MKHYNISITGRVQKIGFRFSAMQAAYRFGIHGFVRNMQDETVYIEAEGEEEQIKSFVQWCNRGPMGARVENVEVSEGELKNFSGFDIISSRAGQNMKY
jgi:acylphosphatase